MRTPDDFGGLSGVLNTAMVIVAVMFLAVGFYGYLKFGDAILGSITLNLPADHWFEFYYFSSYITRNIYEVVKHSLWSTL